MTLFISLVSLHWKYSLQTKGLQAELADSNAAITECATELNSLQAQLAERSALEEYTTENGFAKKGGIYLIDTGSQLVKLSQMIQECAEIEPGIAAADASYRLRNNIEVGPNWFSIGTETTPFCGSFDGDGHRIRGKLSKSGNTVYALFQTGGSAQIKNLAAFPDCRVHLGIYGWDFDTQKIADALRERWERIKGII